MSGNNIPQWIVGIVLICVLGAFLFRWLRRAECMPAISGLLCALVIAQPAYWRFQTSIGAILLSAAAGSVAYAAISFAERQDVRRIALLGGSLAGAQLVNPLWGAATTIMLPLALRSRLGDGKAGGLTGLYVSILFIPVLTAVGVAFLDGRFRSEMWALAHLHSAQPGMRVFAASLLPAAPLAAALALRPWDAAASIIAVVGFALLAASVALDMVAIESTSVSAAFAVLSFALIAASVPRPLRRSWALSLLSSTLLASWISAWLARIDG